MMPYPFDPNQQQLNYMYYQPQQMMPPTQNANLNFMQAQNFYVQPTQQQFQYQYMMQQPQFGVANNVTTPVPVPVNQHKANDLNNKKKIDIEKEKFKSKSNSKVDIDSFTKSLFNKIEVKPTSNVRKSEKSKDETHSNEETNKPHSKAANWNQDLGSLFTETVTTETDNSFNPEWPSSNNDTNQSVSSQVTKPPEPTPVIYQHPAQTPPVIDTTHQLHQQQLIINMSVQDWSRDQSVSPQVAKSPEPVINQNPIEHSMIDTTQQQFQQNTMNMPVQYPIPYWCRDDMVPLVYKQVHDAVTANGTTEIDTNLLYPILILSNIEKTLLGKIWSIVNNTIPGRLVKHELYMALALIALVQQNSQCDSIEFIFPFLYNLIEIPIPIFEFEVKNEPVTNEDNNKPSVEVSENVINEVNTSVESRNNDQEETTEDEWADFNSFQEAEVTPTQNEDLFNVNFDSVQVIEEPIEQDLFNFDKSEINEVIKTQVDEKVEDLFDLDPLKSNSDTKSQVNQITENLFDLNLNFDLNQFEQTTIQPVHSEMFLNFNEFKTMDENKVENLFELNLTNNFQSNEEPAIVIETKIEENKATDLFANFESNNEIHNIDTVSIDVSQNDSHHSEKEDVLVETATATMNIIEDKYAFFSFESDSETAKIENSYDQLWLKFVESIKFLYQNVYKLFLDFCTLNANQEDESVKMMKSDKGAQFLSCFCETYRILNRIKTSIKLYNIPLDSKITSCINEIEKIYQELCNLWKYDNQNETISTESSASISKYNCSLCLAKIDNSNQIQFSSNFYHNTCINYWLNCVDQHAFPNLKVPF